jgi:hypothetical protein
MAYGMDGGDVIWGRISIQDCALYSARKYHPRANTSELARGRVKKVLAARTGETAARTGETAAMFERGFGERNNRL